MADVKEDKKPKIQKEWNKPMDPSPGDGMWDTYLYPERRGGEWKRSWFLTLVGFEGREGIAKMKCETNVIKALKHPFIKLFIGALESAGCKFDIGRHVVCEICDVRLTGGYDPEFNQVVICQNTCRSEGKVRGTLAHELVHMFDYCENQFDFKNIDHVACSEVRAANLTGCSFLGSAIQGCHPFGKVKQAHQLCVKDRAVMSVLAIKKVTREEAEAAVNRVFTRCYNDLEPVGRRIRRNSNDMERAYREGHYYGYL